MADISYTLLENGLDFISSAIENLSGAPDKRELKYAVLHLHSGIELVLKERLIREHWSLVFEKIDDATMEKYESGDFISVQWKSCISRLKGICKVEISTENLHALDELKKKRNRLEHFNIVDTVEALKSATIPVLNFMIDFVNAELGQDSLHKNDRFLFSEIINGLGNFNDFVAQRMKEIKSSLDTCEGIIVTCPHCFQESMEVFGEANCFFCGFHQDDVTIVVKEYTNNVLDISWRDVAKGDDWPVYACPDCGSETLVHNNENDGSDKPSFVCFECGMSWESLEFCTSCGNPFNDSKDGISICNDCFNMMNAKND